MVLQPQDCMYPLWLRGDVPIPVIFALGWAVSVYQIVTYVCAQCEGKPYSYKSDIFTVFVCLIISLIVWSVRRETVQLQVIVWSVRRETVQLQVGHLYCVCLSDISLIVWSVRRETVQLQVGHPYCVCLSDNFFDCVVRAKGNCTATSRTSLLCLFV